MPRHLPLPIHTSVHMRNRLANYKQATYGYSKCTPEPA